MATVNDKEVIYVDGEEDITAIIDKVNGAGSKIVALVLPKRAGVFQSVVNMKLLKRRAERAKKHIVLITSEAGLLPLAGMSGLHVAATLQSKPEIPNAPGSAALGGDNEEKAELDDFDPEADATTPVGELADTQPRVISPAGTAATDEAIELDNTDKPIAAADKAKKSDSPAKQPGGKGFKIPDFFRFRKRILIAIGVLILLIVAYIVMFRVLPAAAINIKTKGKDINSSIDATLSTSEKQLDTASKTLPASLQQQQKNYSQQAAASGQKNNGNKATGTVNITAKKCGGNPFSGPSLPAGSGVSINGLTFITQAGTSFHGTGTDNNNCYTYDSDSATPIQAVQAGASGNINNGQFSVSGNADWTASGTTSGGTDQIVKVVQQSDIDGAKAKLSSATDQTNMKQQLKRELENSGYYAVQPTFNAAPSNVNITAQAGQQADTVTVSESITYTMYGAKKDDLHALIVATANKQIDTSKQSILDDGLDGASFQIPTPGNGPTLKVTLLATATAGPKLDIDNLAQSLAGKKTGDVKNSLHATPGVTDVTVSYSPFWVTSMPHNAEKITIRFQKDTAKDDSN